MADKGVEEKVKVKDWNELSNVPMNSWVEINGVDELVINYNHPNGEISTLSVEDKYVCQKDYNIFLGSLTPTYTGKFLKGTGKGLAQLKIIEENK
jgi:hypothetical protein